MNLSDLALPLIAALWASSNVMLTFTKDLNHKRDQVLIGMIDGQPVSTQHRLLMLRNDWVPLTITFVILTLVFAVIVLAIPPLAKHGNDDPCPECLWLIAGAVSLFSGFCSASWAICAKADYRMMMAQIEEDAKKAPAAA